MPQSPPGRTKSVDRTLKLSFAHNKTVTSQSPTQPRKRSVSCPQKGYVYPTINPGRARQRHQLTYSRNTALPNEPKTPSLSTNRPRDLPLAPKRPDAHPQTQPCQTNPKLFYSQQTRRSIPVPHPDLPPAHATPPCQTNPQLLRHQQTVPPHPAHPKNSKIPNEPKTPLFSTGPPPRAPASDYHGS
jgi:hypothetical protein